MTTLVLRKKSMEAATLLQVILASCFIGICAQISIPLYFTPVPLSAQTFAIMLVGAFLGSRRGALAVLCYLAQGCVGLPVWAGGCSGFGAFLGPSGGYLIGFVLQAYFVGWFLERGSRKTLGVLLLSVFMQLGIGSLWLAYFVGLERCLALGFYPFVLGDSAKALLAAASYLRLSGFALTRRGMNAKTQSRKGGNRKLTPILAALC